MSLLEEPLVGARRSEVGGLVIDEVDAGRGRVKRVIYPPGWRWSTDMAPVTGGDRCMHAHVGFLVQGRMVVEYARRLPRNLRGAGRGGGRARARRLGGG